MHLMRNISVTPKVNIVLITDKIPETKSVEYYTEVEQQVKAALANIDAQINILTKLHECQSICLADVHELKKLFPTQADWLDSLVVTVVPTKTSHSIIMTTLYDVVMQGMVDLTTEIQQRYIDVIPVATDAQPDGTLATSAVLRLVECMQHLYQRTATIAEIADPQSLQSVAGCMHNQDTQASPSTLIKSLTVPEIRAAMVQEFSITRTLLLMVKNNTFSSMNGLRERYALLIKAAQSLPLAKLIPLWKNVN